MPYHANFKLLKKSLKQSKRIQIYLGFDFVEIKLANCIKMEKLKRTYSIDNSFEYKFSILDCLFKQRKLFKECLQYRDVQFISLIIQVVI